MMIVLQWQLCEYSLPQANHHVCNSENITLTFLQYVLDSSGYVQNVIYLVNLIRQNTMRKNDLYVSVSLPFAIQVNVSCQEAPPKPSSPPSHVSMTLKELYVSASWLHFSSGNMLRGWEM